MRIIDFIKAFDTALYETRDYFRDVILDFDWRVGEDMSEGLGEKEEKEKKGEEEEEEEEEKNEIDTVQLVSWSKDQVLRIWHISQDIKFRLGITIITNMQELGVRQNLHSNIYMSKLQSVQLLNDGQMCK